MEDDGPEDPITCMECNNPGGYMKKLLGSKKDPPQFIHPICAITYPKIYQIGSPANMYFKHCQGVDKKSVYEILDHQKENECEICKKISPRML